MISLLLAERCGAPHGFEPPGVDPPRPVWRPRQVHGALIAAAREGGVAEIPADGAWSVDPRCAAAIVAADCAPILIAADDGGAVVAVHAGWRGLAAGVVEAGVRQLLRLRPGGAPLAAIGPAALACCYEVGPEVLAAVRPGERRVVSVSGARPRLDLRGAAADRLLAAGLPAARIDCVGPCTICSTEWPSYRRQGRVAGRILAWIAPRSGRD